MLPRKLGATDPEQVRRSFRVVRLADFTDLPGFILSADADSGLALMKLDNGASQEFQCGPNGLSIVVVGR
jgi:hypothetical protein